MVDRRPALLLENAAHHKKLIQILLFVSLLLAVSGIVWLLTVKK